MKNFICKAEEAPSSAKLLLQSQYELAKNASFFSFLALESLEENVLFHWLMMLWSVGNVMTGESKVTRRIIQDNTSPLVYCQPVLQRIFE